MKPHDLLVYATLLALSWFSVSAPYSAAGPGAKPKSNIILLSGGPALYDPLEKTAPGARPHDVSWANYVTPPGLLHGAGSFKPSASREIWWFVYKPAYEARWKDDLKAKDHRADSVKEVKAGGYASYVDMIGKLAAKRKWNIRWITSSSDLWKRLGTFKSPIERFVYWGHARNDLWLTCTHNTAHEVVEPEASAQVLVKEIKGKGLAKLLKTGVSEFYGCNTVRFAKEWSGQFKTTSVGFDGTIDFRGIHQKPTGVPTFSKTQRKTFEP